MYVGNRGQHIRDRSSPGDWFHVPGKKKPANEAPPPPRGLTAKELLQSNRWLDGPKFLWQQDPLPLQPPPIYALHPSDLEVRKNLASTLSTKTEKVKTSHTGPGILKPDRFNHFSSLNRLKRCIVQVQRTIERLRPNNVHNWRPKEGPSSLKELSRAENIVLRSIQHYHFEQEIKILSTLEGNDNQFQDRRSARKKKQHCQAQPQPSQAGPIHW